VDRGGLRLKLFKAQADAGDIVLLFADESEALTHPYLARAWAKKGADLRVPAPGQAQKIAMMGLLDCAERKLIVTTSGERSPCAAPILIPTSISISRSAAKAIMSTTGAAQRLPRAGLGDARWHGRTAHPQAAQGLVLPELPRAAADG
jgi:hypothetical protein